MLIRDQEQRVALAESSAFRRSGRILRISILGHDVAIRELEQGKWKTIFTTPTVEQAITFINRSR